MNNKMEQALATAAIIALTVPMAARSSSLGSQIASYQKLCENQAVINRQLACEYVEELRATEPIRQQVARENQILMFGKAFIIQSVPTGQSID